MGNNCFRISQHPTDSIFIQDNDDDDDNDYTDPQRVTLGQNQPLLHKQVKWESDIPLTEGQLKSKRDTFWETAPLYDGRKEVWDALKVAAEAAETEDYDLAQAIITGAGVLLPKGKLTDVYDELGNRYIIPSYCLSHPINMDSAENVVINSKSTGNTDQIILKMRLSTQSKDFRYPVLKGDSVETVKQKLKETHSIDPSKLKLFLSGRLLLDNVLIGDLSIPKGFVIQAIVT